MVSQPSAPPRSIPPLVIRGAIVASLGGLLSGFDTAVISGTEEKLTELHVLSSTGEGMIVAVVTIGTIVGAVIVGNLADRFGRKPVLSWAGILFGVGVPATAPTPLPALVNVVDGTVSALSAFPTIFFMIFRFLNDVGVGLSSVAAPIYTAKIVPVRVRGRLVGLAQLNIVFDILPAYVSSAVIRRTAHEDTAWRWMFGVMAAPAVLFLIFLATVPGTPRWLLAHGREELAVKIFEHLTASQAKYDEQTGEMKAQIAEDTAGGKAPFFTRRYRKVIFMAFYIAMFNQLSGISATLYYVPKVMKLVGGAEVLGDAFPCIGSVIVGLMNLVATMAAPTVIDRIGRHQFMIVGSVGYLISFGFLMGMTFACEGGYLEEGSAAPVWLILLGLFDFIASRVSGQGSVIRVLISETFPNCVCARGQSLGSFAHWALAFITTYAFPASTDRLGGGYAFGIFFFAMVGQLFWVLKVTPETKGIPLEEVEEKLGLTNDQDREYRGSSHR